MGGNGDLPFFGTFALLGHCCADSRGKVIGPDFNLPIFFRAGNFLPDLSILP